MICPEKPHKESWPAPHVANLAKISGRPKAFRWLWGLKKRLVQRTELSGDEKPPFESEFYFVTRFWTSDFAGDPCPPTTLEGFPSKTHSHCALCNPLANGRPCPSPPPLPACDVQNLNPASQKKNRRKTTFYLESPSDPNQKWVHDPVILVMTNHV